MFTDEQIELLNEPLSNDNVSTRKGGGGMQLSYIEQHHAIREANRIFGFGNWSRNLVLMEKLLEREYDRSGTDMIEVCYKATVRITLPHKDGTIVRDGTGYGNGQAKAFLVGDAYEMAIKEAESDAMKRALMTFGDQFGLALYDKAQTNVVSGGVTRAKNWMREFKKELLDCSDEDMLAAFLEGEKEKIDLFRQHMDVMWVDDLDKAIEAQRKEVRNA